LDTTLYLERFKNAASQIDKTLLKEKQLKVSTGLYGDSVFLKLYKKSWADSSKDPLLAETRIFFSVWINDSAIREQKLLYNIHALKLRRLKGYSIESRKFADIFRAGFNDFAHQWNNVSVKFGPLTLMEGWVKIDLDEFKDEILELANNFLEIEHLVDNTLAKFKKF
jgi:hypothetical protein